MPSMAAEHTPRQVQWCSLGVSLAHDNTFE